MSQAEKKKIESFLRLLMMHIIKWLSQIEKRSRSWEITISNARNEIVRLQSRKPSLTKYFILKIWNRIFAKSKKEAEQEMKAETKVDKLTWKQVFEDDYEK